MSEQNNFPIIEGNSPENQEKKRTALYIVGIVVICLAVTVAFVLFGRACSIEHHKQYSTGEQYTITGHVVKAKKETRRSGSNHRERHDVYTVELEMEEPLPNGETTFRSGESSEYYAVEKFSSTNALIRFTISPDGYVIRAEKVNDVSKDDTPDFKDPEYLEKFENMNEDEKHDVLFDEWKRRNNQ